MATPTPKDPGTIQRTVCTWLCTSCRRTLGRSALFTDTPAEHCGRPAVPLDTRDAMRRAQWLDDKAGTPKADAPSRPRRLVAFVCTSCHKAMGQHIPGSRPVHDACGGVGYPTDARYIK